jgi:hypothetical protein
MLKSRVEGSERRSQEGQGKGQEVYIGNHPKHDPDITAIRMESVYQKQPAYGSGLTRIDPDRAKLFHAGRRSWSQDGELKVTTPSSLKYIQNG